MLTTNAEGMQLKRILYKGTCHTTSKHTTPPVPEACKLRQLTQLRTPCALRCALRLWGAQESSALICPDLQLWAVLTQQQQMLRQGLGRHDRKQRLTPCAGRHNTQTPTDNLALHDVIREAHVSLVDCISVCLVQTRQLPAGSSSRRSRHNETQAAGTAGNCGEGGMASSDKVTQVQQHIRLHMSSMC
jgi:hypothetical protein